MDVGQAIGKKGEPVRLSKKHLADLRASGLSDRQIHRCCFRTVSDPVKVQEILRWKRSAEALGDCLCIPFVDTTGERTGYCRLKPDRPRKDQNGRAIKYESPKGLPNRVFIPPTTRAALSDVSVPLATVEGEKKSCAADQNGFPTIGLTGVWTWQKKRPRNANGKPVGERELIDDLMSIPWQGRTAYIVFDSDAAVNEKVQDAERCLAQALTRQGAHVKIVRLPAGPDGSKVGLDDYLVAHGPDSFRQMLDTAEPYIALELRTERIGNGKLRVTALFCGDSVHVDEINPANSRHRQRYAKELVEKVPTIRLKTMQAELLALATGDSKAPAADQSEVDVSMIVRPEQFFHPEVSGIAVPVVQTVGGKPSAAYRLFLQWSNGPRESRPLCQSLDLADGKKLWMHPQPGVPGVAPSDWSADGRQAWLDGKMAPNAADLFRGIRDRILRYVDLPADKAQGIGNTLALWIMLTYTFRAWPAVPYLHLGGPMASGKSRTFEVLSRLCLRPLSSSSMTGPVMFRSLHDRGGTLLFDEAERLRQTNDPGQQEVLSMLLCGYRRGGTATRLEPVGDGFRAVSFDVFGPKALAAINALPPVLASRCISISMVRAGADSPAPKRRIDAGPSRWQSLRDDLHVIALEHGPTWIELSRRNEVCPTGIHGRNHELWQPLLALAAWTEDQGEPGLLAMMQSHALDTIASSKDDAIPESDETLLEILAEWIGDGRHPEPGEVLREAQQRDHATFAKWGPRTVSNRLKAYGVQARRSDGKRRFKTSLEQLADIANRYRIEILGDTHPQNCAPCAPVDMKTSKNTDSNPLSLRPVVRPEGRDEAKRAQRTCRASGTGRKRDATLRPSGAQKGAQENASKRCEHRHLLTHRGARGARSGCVSLKKTCIR